MANAAWRHFRVEAPISINDETRVHRGIWSPFHPDARADAVIRRHLSSVVHAILETCGPSTILLTGSFGRGEGSVLIEENRIRILSDIEIAVVSSDPRVRRPLQAISESLSSASGIETCLFWVRPDSLQRWRIKSLSFGEQPLTVKIYDILAGSRVLSGNSPSVTIPEPALIPRWEGMRLIFNRMIEALVVEEEHPTPEAHAKATSKLVLAGADALLIDQQLYDVSLKERASRYENACRAFSKTSALESDRVLELCQWATSYKLQPQRIKRPDARELRLAASRFAEDGMRYLINRELGLEFTDYADGMCRYLRSPRVRWSFIDYRLGRLTNPLYPNLIYAAKLARSKERPPLRAMRYALLPWDQVIYACGAILFHAVHSESEPEVRHLEVVDDLLRPLIGSPLSAGDLKTRSRSQVKAMTSLWKKLLG